MANTPFLFVPTFSWPAAPFGLLYTYQAGSTTPKTTYSDAAGSVPNTNPVELDDVGSATIRLGTGSYKFVLLDQTNTVTLWEQDNYDPAFLTQSTMGATFYPAITAESGVTIVQPWMQYGYADRYAVNTSPGVTDMSSAFSAAALVASRMGCKVRWGLSAPYLLSNPVNCTGIRGVVFEDESSGNYSNNTPSIIIGHTGHGFDLSTSTELTFNNVVISNAAATVPKTAFFSARNAGGAGCGMHRLNNCRTAFNSTFSWFWYGYGSEENTFFNCEISNNQNGSGLFSHNQTNPAAYTSSFVTIASGAQSNTENHHYGFGYFNFGNSGSQNEILIQLENTGNFTMKDGTAGVAHGLAYVNVLGNTASTNLTFDSIRGEPIGTKPIYGVMVNNTAGTHQSWTFNNVTADAINELLHFNAAQTPTIQNLAMRATTCTSGLLLLAYNMSNSIIESMIDSVVTGSVGGNQSSNVFIGGRNNVLLSGTAQLNTYIDNNLGAVGIDGDSYVAASSACTGALTTSVSWSLRLSPSNKQVTLALPATTGTTTANPSFTYAVSIPSQYRPPANQWFTCVIEDNGATVATPGLLQITTAGVITILKSAGGGNFTNAATGGLQTATCVTWNL
jgi:hypothetical protein